MSVFSIDEFISTVGKKGFQDPTRYSVMVIGPNGPLTYDDAKYCSAVTAPGISFDTTDHFIHGPIRNVASHEKYDEPITLTFYNDYDMKEYQYFYDWMTKIGDEKFYIQYYKEYIGEMAITSYDREGEARVLISCSEVYPVSLSPYSFAYNKRDQIPTFNVTMNCHHVEMKKL